MSRFTVRSGQILAMFFASSLLCGCLNPYYGAYPYGQPMMRRHGSGHTEHTRYPSMEIALTGGSLAKPPAVTD